MPRKGGKGGKPTEGSEDNKAPKGALNFDPSDPGNEAQLQKIKFASNSVSYSFDAKEIGICCRQEFWLL